MAVGLMWYDGNKSHETLSPYFDNKTLGCFPGTPRSEFRGGASNVVWAAAHNQFFGVMAMPQTPAQEVVARAIELPRPATGPFSSANKPLRKGFETTLIYSAATIEPGKTLEQQVSLFIGPKEYQTLASIAGRYSNNVDQAMGFGFFGFFSKGSAAGDELAAPSAFDSVWLGDHRPDHPAQDHFLAADRGEHPLRSKDGRPRPRS
jgi:YidC/Oxa1 family membrane protein insertase